MSGIRCKPQPRCTVKSSRYFCARGGGFTAVIDRAVPATRRYRSPVREGRLIGVRNPPNYVVRRAVYSRFGVCDWDFPGWVANAIPGKMPRGLSTSIALKALVGRLSNPAWREP